MNLYPQPNLAGNSSYNYQTEVLNDTHVDELQSRLNKTIGHRDMMYGGFAFSSSRADSTNLFGFVDTTNSLGIDTNVNWSHRYRHQTFVLLGYHLTRLRTEVQPAFAGSENVSGNAGIGGNDQDMLGLGSAGPHIFKRNYRAQRRQQRLQSQPHGHAFSRCEDQPAPS